MSSELYKTRKFAVYLKEDMRKIYSWEDCCGVKTLTC